MNQLRIQIFCILTMALVVILLLPRLTTEFLNRLVNQTHIEPRAEAEALNRTNPAARAQPQQSAAELKAASLEQKLISKANQQRLIAEDVERFKQIIKETEKSFAEIRQRKKVDPISFIKEASERAGLYLQIGDKHSAFNLYKEAVLSLKEITPTPDTSQFEDPLWQFLLEYLKTVKSKEEERDAIERLLRASDRKQSIPYIGGSFQIASYFASMGRKQDALDFLLKVIALELKNRPEDVESLTASSIELEGLSFEMKQQVQVEKVYRDILAATEKHHANQGASIILPLANLSAFCIKNDQLEEGHRLAERALKIAEDETSTCLLDKLAIIADSYTVSNQLDKAERFLRKATDIKMNRFKNVELSPLGNSYRELKTKYEERGQWTVAESFLEQFRLAQVPGKYSEMCVLQDLFFGNIEEAGRLQSLGKNTEAQDSLRKADDAYLKVKTYFLKEPQPTVVQSWVETRKNRLKALGLSDSLLD